MSDKKRNMVEGYDVEYNRLSQTLKMTLVLDKDAIEQVLLTSVSPLLTEEAVGNQILELLNRSINLNTPRIMQAGPHGPKWRRHD